MKKMVFSAVCLTASFMFLAFTPAEKNTTVDFDITTEATFAAGCFRFNETIKDFTSCYEISTEEEEISPIGDVLGDL